jgi:alkylation response protein AidB-like acyl-CoA dehydrogenase
VYLSDVIELTGEVIGKRVDDDGEHVVDVRTTATNHRGEMTMPRQRSDCLAQPAAATVAGGSAGQVGALAMGETPTLKEFAVEVETFLAERYPRRNKTATEPFTWGQGSDEVRVFQEPDPEEEAHAVPALRAWRKALWDNGLGWVSGPVEYGGRGLPAAYSRTFERLAQGFVVPGDAALTVSLGMIAPTIARHGSEGQKQRYLPKMYSGELIACQLFSEPDAGSDLASVTTSARRDGDLWRLSGQKVWTSGAHLADFGEIITRTAAGPRHHNLTAFLVDMHASGVEVRPLRQMTGGASLNEVFLDDVAVCDDDRLGEVDQGWPVALTTLSHERNAMGHSAFGGVGILSTERLIQLVRHAGRDIDGGPAGLSGRSSPSCGWRATPSR